MVFNLYYINRQLTFVISVYQYLWKGSFIEIHDVIVLNRPLADLSVLKCPDMSGVVRRVLTCRAGVGIFGLPFNLKPRRIDKI